MEKFYQPETVGALIEFLQQFDTSTEIVNEAGGGAPVISVDISGAKPVIVFG